MTDKPILYTLIRNDPKTPEGKYLVKRRDGTVVEWPHFVLGARDPASPIALRAYADAAEQLKTCTPEMCEDVRQYANLFDTYRQEHGAGDPGLGLHRQDDPATIAEMKKGASA